jgi:acyl-CoA synthetase (AMP-forming)/AMP-acid ligase II
VILDLLRGWADRTPDAAFVVSDEGTYSYAAVYDRSCRFARQLAEAGIGRGDHVALLAGNSTAYLVAWFGINALGAVAVMLNSQLISDAMDYLVGQSDSRLIVADAPWIARCASDLQEGRDRLPRICIEDEASFLAGLTAWAPVEPVSCAPLDTCTILYTSGTTGRPKGVLCSHAGHLAVGRETARIVNLTRADRTLVFMPLFHTNPQMYAVMSALTVGCSLALRPRFSATTFFEDAQRFAATGCTFVGTVLAILASRYPTQQTAHRLRFAIGGGTTRELATLMQDRFGICVHEMYGMTEIGGWVSANAAGAYRIGSAGQPRHDMDVRIVDAEDNEVGAGQAGEIVVRPLAPGAILSGYYKRPEAFAAACRNLWFHTGDIGSFDTDGFLYFHGRAGELIRRGGEMIAPAEIEDLLRRVPGVVDCAALAVPDPIMGDEVKVVVVTDDAMTHQEVRDRLAASLPDFKLPRYVEFAQHIPRTATEKILRRELQHIDGAVVDLKPRR